MQMYRMTAIVLLSLTAPAAAMNQDPPLTREEAAETLALVSQDQRMTVPVQIAGAGPYRFIIDTGAQHTVMTRRAAEQAGANVDESDTQLVGFREVTARPGVLDTLEV